ncbi:MAG TPA: DegQ family serine endoprotease [Methylomirabilota bacterium]|nr:DegQ family serine endoprotease [Methylomirabilota bacterium]
MRRFIRNKTTIGIVVVLAAVLGLVAAGPRLGFTYGAPAPLWSDKPLAVAPLAPVAAPNWVEIAKALRPAVVNISAKRVQEGVTLPGSRGGEDPFAPFFRQFGVEPRHTVRSLGSGFIINSNGYIVTNNHVVQDATDIKVKGDDGRELPAKVVGRDPRTDLALIKIDATGLPVIPLGDSSQLQVGEQVMAIGNPFGLERTVTTGIVSAVGRVIGQGPYDDFIQTDASINPGNSGGPLLNSRGQAIGINAAIFSQSGGSVGIGFAIPINQAKSAVTQLAQAGKVTRGWLGVTIQPLTRDLARGFKVPEAGGALVADVQANSPAATAGLRAGDVITVYDGHKLSRPGDLSRLVADTPVGRQVTLSIVRDGKPSTLNVKVAELQDSEHQVAAAGSDKPSSYGLTVAPVTPSVAHELGLPAVRGVVVSDVQDGSPAADAGIRPGDVIAEVDHQPIRDMSDMKRALDKHAKGAPLVMRLNRDGNNLYVSVAA